MSIGIIAMLLSGIIFGVMDVLLKKIQQPGYTFPITMMRSGLTVIGLLLLYVCIPNALLQQIKWIHQPTIIELEKIPLAALLCGLYSFGLLFFMMALKYKTATETLGLNKIGVVLGVLIGVLLYNEPLTNGKIIACICIILGVVLIEYKLLSRGTKMSNSKGLMFMILARIFWALGFLFMPFIQGLGILLFALILEGMVFVVSSLCYVFDKHKVPLRKWNIKPIMKPIVILAIMAILVQISINISMVNIPIVLIAFLNLVSPTVSLLLSKYYLKESIENIQWVGVAMGIIGGIVIAL